MHSIVLIYYMHILANVSVVLRLQSLVNNFLIVCHNLVLCES